MRCVVCNKEVDHLINGQFCHTCYCRHRYHTDILYRERNAASCKRYKKKNFSKVAAKKKEYESKNREVILNKKKILKKENRYYYTSLESHRRASKVNATPEWLSNSQKEEIEVKYFISQFLSEITGKMYHVDHIIPLRGKLVRGLHVPWNLQILLATDNMVKHNKVSDQ